MYGGEVPSEYKHDRLRAQLDSHGDPGELAIIQDEIDKIDHEAMYTDAEDDPSGHLPDLEESDSVNTSVYDRLGATPASTAISTDTKVAGDMLNLTMGQPEPPAPMIWPMTLIKMTTCWRTCFRFLLRLRFFQVPLPAKPQLNPWALMAEAKFKSGWRTLPPPPDLRRHIEDPDSNTCNMVL